RTAGPMSVAGVITTDAGAAGSAVTNVQVCVAVRGRRQEASPRSWPLPTTPPESVVLPVTARVFSVVAPLTLRLARVVAPETARVLLKVAAPLTERVLRAVAPV